MELTPTPAPAQTVDDATKLRIAQQLLRLAGTYPGHHGRLRAARIVVGMPIEVHPNDEHIDLTEFVAASGVPMRHGRDIADSMLAAGLLAQTRGPRPVLVLTLAGLRELDRLTAPGQSASGDE